MCKFTIYFNMSKQFSIIFNFRKFMVHTKNKQLPALSIQAAVCFFGECYFSLMLSTMGFSVSASGSV